MVDGVWFFGKMRSVEGPFRVIGRRIMGGIYMNKNLKNIIVFSSLFVVGNVVAMDHGKPPLYPKPKSKTVGARKAVTPSRSPESPRQNSVYMGIRGGGSFDLGSFRRVAGGLGSKRTKGVCPSRISVNKNKS